MDSIEKQFQAGIDKAMAIRDKAYMIWLTNLCYKLIIAAENNKEYDNITGNTVTSYACGIYENSKLIKVVTDISIPPPVRVKLTEGETMPAGSVSYDGYLKTSFTGSVPTDQRYGDDYSWMFLANFRPNHKGFAIVMTTGTEYSLYLETAKHLDVLTKTFNDADNLINGLI